MTTALVAQHEVEEEIAVLRGEKERERGVPDWSGSRCHVICAVMCRLAVSHFSSPSALLRMRRDALAHRQAPTVLGSVREFRLRSPKS